MVGVAAFSCGTSVTGLMRAVVGVRPTGVDQGQRPAVYQRVSVRACASRKVAINGESQKATIDQESFTSLLYESQRRLCSQIEAIDGSQTFSSDPWESPTGGGLTRVLQGGDVFEKAGVNVSVVHGELSEARAQAMRSRGRPVTVGSVYHAAALSLVMHSSSPFIPTLRGDVRIFAADGRVWGGGGADLTIFYVDRPAFRAFHRHWKDVCDSFDPGLYPDFKRQCDEYFYIPARGEHRGVGGIFYDELDDPFLHDFQRAVLENFLPSYRPIIEANVGRKWTAEQKRWQRIRRGRYLEFNLLNDRGVKFGLAGAPVDRTDAIMISAPPSVEWPYRHCPVEGSPEDEALQILSGSPVDWLTAN